MQQEYKTSTADINSLITIFFITFILKSTDDWLDNISNTLNLFFLIEYFFRETKEGEGKDANWLVTEVWRHLIFAERLSSWPGISDY